MKPDAVLFDLDATLCRRRWSPETVLSGAFDEVGVTPYTTASEMSAVVNDVPTAEDDVAFYTNCLEAAAARTDATPERAEAVARSYHRAIDYADVEFVPGAEAALRETDAPLGLVTNGSEATQRAKLDALGIADRFDVRVFADTGGIKPDPAPFEHALSELDVDPQGTVHVGDSLQADVAGANALGIRSVWISHGEAGPVDEVRPDHIIESPVGLPDLLRTT
ncbi:HAD family hydrolase [Halococcus hamelinensis]|uniref:HAD-superfamily hydrolase, subfamily IA, variant 3 n=1 Tax=Halococcus hamelinensis 100A6 TaxID=1132509 RepID=M0LZJ6_9EURY|nr:HAD family hydrolase [Halococcus hamelinensis]EMA38987.1 HAD-superfamily hydrolase, subfamily IA, variant 3 [Halococcus hamelinensis 100A6]